MAKSKGKIIFGLFAFAFIAIVFLFSSSAKAADDHVVINEIYSHPNSGENEWLEFYNPTLTDIDLSNYTIEDGSHKPKTLSGIIVSSGYFIIEKTTGGFTFSLNDDGDELILKDTGVIIDQIDYGGWNDNQDNQPPPPTQGKSLQRIPNGSDSDSVNDFRVLLPSKNSKNLLPDYSDKVIINEILPQPATTSADEFIELYNTGSVDVDLSGWQIDDIENGGSSPYTIPDDTKILAGGYLIFYNLVDHISLNDSGDTVRLIDPNGDEKSSVEYTTSNRGQSYSKFSDGWKWTTTLTPQAENILTFQVDIPDQDIPIIITDISGARNQPDGETVQITGTVSVLPGKLSSQYFYIQDGNSGIQIYLYDKNFPVLNLGDEIRVTGEMATISGERRLKISQASDIIILATHPPPEPKKIKIDQIAENFEGKYISVIGVVTKTSGSTFYIHGSGEIQISIREGTGIKKPRMKVGDKVQIAGILSQYGESYRILPTSQNDVKIISSSGLATTGPKEVIYFIITFFLWSIYQILFLKPKNWQKSFCQNIRK